MNTVTAQTTFTPIQQFIYKLTHWMSLDDTTRNIRALSEAHGTEYRPGCSMTYLTELKFYEKLLREGRVSFSGDIGSSKHLFWIKGRRSGGTTYALIHCMRNLHSHLFIPLNHSQGRLHQTAAVGLKTVSSFRGGPYADILVADEFLHNGSSASLVEEDMRPLLPKGTAILVGSGSASTSESRFKEGNFPGFWKIRTASWEGTHIPLHHLDLGAQHSPSTFDVEFGLSWR